MIIVAMTMFLAGIDMSASTQRKALVTCLQQVQAKAKTDKVATGGFEAYARTNCSGQMNALRDALIVIDSKNGIGRSEAAANARMDIDTYFATAVERYTMDVETQVAATPQ
jgi:hypothetical protein